MNHIANRFTVVFDACVLFSAPRRDLLLRLAREDLFRAKWTNEIHEEWISAVLTQRPNLERARLERTRDLMNANVRDCLVEGHGELIEGLTLPDMNDRHVLAAAIHSSANAIITLNLKDFPTECLERYGIEAIHPDDFVMNQMDLFRPVVLRVIKQQRESLKNPPKTVNEFLVSIEKSDLARTASELRKYREFI